MAVAAGAVLALIGAWQFWMRGAEVREPLAMLARAEGSTREEAERAAIETAERRLGRTRVHQTE